MSAAHFGKYLSTVDSGVTWIGRIPSHWGVSRLKTALAIPMQYGANEAADLDDRTLPRFIRITDIDETGRLREETFRSLPQSVAAPYLLHDKDILLARSGATVGKSFIYSADWGKCCFAGYLIRVRLCSSRCLPEWLYYYCQTRNYWEYIAGSQIQATIQNVSAEKYANLQLPLPAVDEQTQIAKFLDYETAKIDALIEKQQQLIELLKEKRQAVISHAVTKGLNPDAPMRDSGVEWLGRVPAHWEVRKLKQISEKLQGRLIVQPHRFFAEDGVPIVFGNNIRNGRIDTSDICRISSAADSAHPHAKARAGDILTVRVGEPGETAVVPQALDGCHFASIMWIHQHPRFVSEWLAHCMNSNVVRRQIDAVNYGAAQTQFNISDAASFVLPFPPLEEQRAIAEYLDKSASESEALAGSAEELMTLLTERRSALISAAVTGKIDVRDWKPPTSDVEVEVA